MYNSSSYSVGEQEDIEGLALETDCLPRYVAKGIALGCFVYARCLHHGLGVEQNREQAKCWYSRVSMISYDSLTRPRKIIAWLTCSSVSITRHKYM